MALARLAAVGSVGLLAACPGPRGPGAADIGGITLEIGRPGATLAGIAADGPVVFAALNASSAASSASASAGAVPAASTAAGTVVMALQPARSGATPLWQAQVAGSGGPLVASSGLVVAAVAGTGAAGGVALRGEPGAVLVALDAASGAARWQLAVDATDWSVIAALGATSDGVLVGGSFAGTLRIGASVVSSAGKSDGFVARIAAAGSVAWLVRVGGPGADAIQGVAAAGDRIAIAGTFAGGADVLGQPLAAFDERSPSADGFVAELDAAGAPRWAQPFGGKADDAVAGVAIDARGQVVVAATARDTVHVGGADHVANGPADGLVAWWTAKGEPGTATLIGGADFDGLRAITATGDRIVVAGFYAGALRLGGRTLTATGGDDAFLASLDPAGTVVDAWPISGDGREEVTALAALPGGFAAGVAHTAAAHVGGDALPAPRDPLGGAAIAVRGAR